MTRCLAAPPPTESGPSLHLYIRICRSGLLRSCAATLYEPFVPAEMFTIHRFTVVYYESSLLLIEFLSLSPLTQLVRCWRGCTTSGIGSRRREQVTQ